MAKEEIETKGNARSVREWLVADIERGLIHCQRQLPNRHMSANDAYVYCLIAAGFIANAASRALRNKHMVEVDKR